MRLLIAVALLVQGAALAQPKPVLYLTHSAGFRHDVLELSHEVLRDIGARSGKFTVTATDDLSALNDLSAYSAVVFFTSGELALSSEQKHRLLDFVQGGGGFAGIHSATDTFYTWPEYGELIGGHFDGHPWTQQVRIDIEDPSFVPAPAASISLTDEIYQFREFSRDRVRVLMTLDTTSVDVTAAGVNRTDDDFALAWTRPYGSGRVFYTALGHFDSTWRNEWFQSLLEKAVLWITRQTDDDGEPRPSVQTSLAAGGIGNAATMEPRMTVSPGSLISIYGTSLTSGGSAAGDRWSRRLAGTRVLLNGAPVHLWWASPTQLNVVVPASLESTGTATLVVQAAGSEPVATQVAVARTTPGILVPVVAGRYATLWATGLGVDANPQVAVNGVEARVLYSGLSEWDGLYQVNVEIPSGLSEPYVFALR